jgi:orotidine-5'-phosphate decarboxylase
MTETFMQKLDARFSEGKFVCVGLDPDLNKIPTSHNRKYKFIEDSIFEFNKAIIDTTADYACAFKPNSAFYEAYGEDGYRMLKRTARYLHEAYPAIPTILDAKRADISNTNERYATAIFDELGFEGLTVHPYLGHEAVQPFLDRKDKGIFVLVKTSNDGSGEFQDLIVGNEVLYEHVARSVALGWNQNLNCGVVVGATHPEEIAKVRAVVGDMPILIPGIGAQGGDAAAAFKAARNSKGGGVLIAASRSIMYALDGPDFAEAARAAVEKLSAEVVL